MACVVVGNLVLSGVVGVECVLGVQTKAGCCSLPSFSPQRGGGMNGVM
jgi:hypothetical protein